MVTDLLDGGDENEDGEHEEGNRTRDDDGAEKCTDLGLCNIHPVRIRPGTFCLLL